MSTAKKESISGPADLIARARSAAEQTLGKQNGAWSRWVCDAIREKLNRDGYDVPEHKQVVAAAVTEAEEAKVDVVDVLSRATRSAKRRAAA